MSQVHHVQIDPPPEMPGTPAQPGSYMHPRIDRRRAARATQKFVTQMTPWAPGHASVPFEVVINDMSETGVGIIHDQPLKVGLRHLLTVPGAAGKKPLTLEYLVVRCERRGDGNYMIGLERSIARDSVDQPAKRVVSERVKLLFLLFGLFGLIIAAFAPL
jgi:hypothetical protein